MEGLLLLFGLGLALLLIAAPVLALVAVARTSRLARDLDQARADIEALERRLSGVARQRTAPTAMAPVAAPDHETASPGAVARDVPPTPAGAPPEAAAPGVAAGPPLPPPSPATSPSPSSLATPRAPGPAAPGPPADFATNLGPRLLVGAGALAVVVFLGYFVRYAWENNWVGPTGRVLSGAVFSLGLVAAGLRLMQREYRPLAQGLAAAGLAGLYVTAFAAHSVYGLVPRTASAAFMFAVTASAVVLAERLDARLLAALAWIGGYLAPVLLSTGEDKAVSLFGYLALLGAGAVWLDRRRPWPETLPLALAGTALLYAGWYAAHFRPERFGVAIGGLLVLGALFALGAAEKERPAWLAILAVFAAIGLAALGQDANRPEVVLPVSLLVAGALLRAPGLRLAGVVAAPLVVAVPFVAWAAAHYRPESFGIAAGWVAAGAVLVALASPEAMAPSALMPAIALLGGGLASIGLAASSDRPLGILGLLAAQAGLAVLVSRRFAWAEAAGSVLGAAAVLAWLDRFLGRDRGTEALALGLTVAALYFLIVTVRGFLGEKLGAPGALTHVAAAGLAWAVLYRVLDLTAPSLLGPSAVAAGALHLAAGLAARQRGGDPLRVRVTLGLAAAFLTIAIPVQLGLHGITVGWALEGVLLLWLGLRNRSWLARAFGYGVLTLAVVRLLVRHLPLHPGAFSPVLNPTFGTWLAVVASLLAAHALIGRRHLPDENDWLDGAARLLLTPLALVLLLGLLTVETHSAFAQSARAALAAGDPEGALSSRRQGDLAVSVLWTLFATGLLAAGLAARSRGLFYAAYALFAITAGKVVLVDLSSLPTLYRMLAFLALGVLLLAGAWLNLRFRERIAPPRSEAA